MEIAMVLHKGIIFMRFYFLFALLFAFARCSDAERRFSNSSIKSMIVHEIMKKISNITLNSLSKPAPEKKETILNKIENKLRKSAKAMGPDGNKYVKFIMDEFKTKAFTKEKEKNNATYILRKSIELRTNQKAAPHSVMDTDTKKEIIKDISEKIQALAKKIMKHAKTSESKKQILEKIKHRIEESARQKHMQIHNKHEELKAYSSLIAQGVEVSMQKLLENDTPERRMDSKVNEQFDRLLETSKPKLETGSQHQIHENKNTNYTDAEDGLLKKTMVVMDIEEMNKYKNLISVSLNDTSIDPRCDEIVDEACVGIQSFSKIRCGAGKSISIEHLCNGVVDCLDKVDEVNCTSQSMEKVRKATAVMADIESSLHHKCFATTGDGYILTSQNQILRDVLQTQMDFLEKHLDTPLKLTQDRDEVDDMFVKKTVSDVNMILSTLSYALDGTLCAHNVDPDHADSNTARKFNDIDDFENVPKDSNWSPKLCVCTSQFCKAETCEAPCKRVCWQRYSLNHWGCTAISGGTSVSLNVICDGKLDCFDETDESSCATDSNFSKFEASKTYSALLDFLSTKSKSYEFVKSRNKLVAMHGLVRQLQKETTKTNTDAHTIKAFRDECFTLLVSIYDDIKESSQFYELDDRYLILLAINEKLVTALKRSHTGNDNLINSKGCVCRDGLCALRRCNKNCIQACLAETALTKFECSNTTSVLVDSICNGRKDCPNGEDEEKCVQEVCRGHHLVVLRHNIQDVSKPYTGSIMGEILESWKNKVSAALFIAENTERPNHKTMVEIITRVLQDLVTSFAAMEDYRRINSEYALKEFVAISNIVKMTLKSCSY